MRVKHQIRASYADSEIYHPDLWFLDGEKNIDGVLCSKDTVMYGTWRDITDAGYGNYGATISACGALSTLGFYWQI
jgi:hypothetical protein